MKTAKLANYHSIIKDGKEVGKIQILNYYDSGVPQLEYDLDKEYCGKGIMTQELRDYIERIKDNYKFLIAIVKKDNLASMRVLEKVGFSDILYKNVMNFWKKYKDKRKLRKKLEKEKKELREKLEKEKKELREKLEKARFINFYGNEIDLSLGRIIELIHYNKTTTISSYFDDDYEDIEYSILLKYDNFKERYLSYEQRKGTRDKHIYELDNFIKSDKFTEYLNNYENLKREYEQL